MNRAAYMTITFAIFCLNLVLLPPCSAQEPDGVADRLLEELKSSPAAEKEPQTPSAQNWRSMAEEMTRIAKQLPDPNAARETLAAQTALIQQFQRLLQESKSTPGGPTTPQTASQAENQARSGGRPEIGRPPGERPSGAPGQGDAASSGAERGGKQGDDPAAGPANLEGLVRRAWGQLPGRVRERLLSSVPEKFLPKYQAETEQYFRRLSEMEHQP